MTLISAKTKVRLASGRLVKAEDVRWGEELRGENGTAEKVVKLVRGKGQMWKVEAKDPSHPSRSYRPIFIHEALLPQIDRRVYEVEKSEEGQYYGFITSPGACIEMVSGLLLHTRLPEAGNGK